MRAALAAVAALAAAAPAHACPAAPAPPSDRRPASAGAIGEYLEAVAARSPRVRLLDAGRSVRGRPLAYAAVSTRANLARLEQLADTARRVRAGELSGLPADAPLFAWVAGGVHGDEPSGADAQLRLLAELVSGPGCDRLLRRLVVFLLPLQNPDGRAGSRTNAWRFDLNRDWFAATQPETRGKLAALEHYPPAVFVDQHEEGGTGFFFPPNADPLHHELPRGAVATINGVASPSVRRAFRARGDDFANFLTYDMFFMGYGDTAPTTRFGAAGMTYEKGDGSPYRDRVAEQLLAARATLRALAARRALVLRRWAAGWRRARAQGARGLLQPNRVVQPGSEVRFDVPSDPVYGHAFSGGDADALAVRLEGAGVDVVRLAAPLAVPALRRHGAASAAPATLPAGAYVVTLAQTGKHWVQALLGDDPYVPFPYFYDVASWSNPLLMGTDGGALEAPVTLPADAGPPPASSAERFPGGSQAALERAFALLAAGSAVRRTPDGGFTTGADGLPLRAPRVAVLDDGGQPAGWTAWLLQERFSLDAPLLAAGAVAARLGQLDVLVVPDGAAPDLGTAALVALQAWIRGGGTLIGARTAGVAVARAAGVTAVRTVQAPPDLQTPGNPVRLLLDTADPVALGERAESFALNAQDPLFDAGTAKVLARYPEDARFFVSGYATGTGVLRGAPAVTDETVGAGRVVLFAFDPVFRGSVEATQRLVGNALLAPPPGGATPRRATDPVDPSALAMVRGAPRDVVVRVAAADEAALLDAARAAGVRGPLRVERDLTTVALRVRGAGERPWTRRLPAALAARGVRPLIAVL